HSEPVLGQGVPGLGACGVLEEYHEWHVTTHPLMLQHIDTALATDTGGAVRRSTAGWRDACRDPRPDRGVGRLRPGDPPASPAAGTPGDACPRPGHTDPPRPVDRGRAGGHAPRPRAP